MLKYILFNLIELAISTCVGVQAMQLAIWAGASNGWSLSTAILAFVCSSFFIRFSNKKR